MTIIITDKNNKTMKLERENFGNEEEVQEYIHENPESLPLYEISEDIQLLILKREFQTNSGPADAVGIDNEGNIYIIETKLYKNSDKRQVLAQVLDYGASIWKNIDYQSFKNILDNEIRNLEEISLKEKVKDFFDFVEDEEVDELFQNLEKNFNSAIFKFVVLMDKIDDRLKDLIIFMNQNTNFDIYGVELDLYKFDGNKIIIPRLFGVEVKKKNGIKQIIRSEIEEKRKKFWEKFIRLNNNQNQIFINKKTIPYKNYLKFGLGKEGIDGRIKIEKDSILLDVYIKPKAMDKYYYRLESMSGTISNELGISSEEWLYSRNVWIEKISNHGEIKLKRFKLDLNNEETWEKSIKELIPWIEKIEKVFREWLPKC